MWLSFLLAGGIAALQAYSFSKLGARYPSGGGMLAYLTAGFADGHVTGVTCWLLYGANAIVTAVALLVFSAVTLAHFQVRKETGASFVILVLAVSSTLVTLLVFCATTLVDQPATGIALVALIVLATVVELLWKRTRERRQIRSAPRAL